MKANIKIPLVTDFNTAIINVLLQILAAVPLKDMDQFRNMAKLSTALRRTNDELMNEIKEYRKKVQEKENDDDEIPYPQREFEFSEEQLKVIVKFIEEGKVTNVTPEIGFLIEQLEKHGY